MAALQSHPWPGNVRELRNMVERLMLLATEGQVDLPTVQMALPKTLSGVAIGSTTSSSGPLADRVQSFEREVILAELKRSHHNMSLAAKALGLERSHLYKKAEQLGIDLRTMRREQGTRTDPRSLLQNDLGDCPWREHSGLSVSSSSFPFQFTQLSRPRRQPTVFEWSRRGFP